MTKKATVYRMVMDKHICPYGLKSIDLLKTQGYEVEDHHIPISLININKVFCFT